MTGEMRVLLNGGGVDSALTSFMLRKFNNNFLDLHVDYGQRASTYERKAVSMQSHRRIQKFPLLVTSYFKEDEKNFLFTGNPNDPVELEGRNEHLIYSAIHFLRSNYIFQTLTLYVGAEPTLKPFADCTLEFFKDLEVSHNNETKHSKIYIKAPLLEVTKSVKEYENWRDDVFHLPSFRTEFFHRVASCWNPKDNMPCGNCKHCLKMKAFNFPQMERM